MSKLGDFLKNNGLKVLGRAAKVGVGFAAGGPAGAIAAAAQALGLPDGSDEAAVLEAVKADPSSLAKLREVENAIPLAQIEADLKMFEAELYNEREFHALNTSDRASARNMAISKPEDNTTKVLSAAAMVSFAAAVITLIFIPIPPNSKDILLVSIGALSSMCGQVYSFYFGSSSGSKEKSKTIEGLSDE